MKNFLILLALGTCSIFLHAQATEAKSGKEKPIDVSLANDNGKAVLASGKEAVIARLRKMFTANKAPVNLGKSNFKELPPHIQEIKGNDGKSTLIYRFRYQNPEPMMDAVESVLSESGSAEMIKKPGADADERSLIVIHDRTDRIPQLRELLLSLDKMQPQVLVETQIIEVYFDQGAQRDFKMTYTYQDGKYGTTNTFGINQSAPSQDSSGDNGGGFDFFPYQFNQSDGSTGRLNFAVKWLNSSSDAKILSAPNIVADQGTTASFITGEDIPIPEITALTSSTTSSYIYKRVGVTLKITPVIISGNTVQLEVNPEVKSVIRYQSFAQQTSTGKYEYSSVPVISVRSVDTRLTVADGDIIALGGLYSSEKSESMDKVPYLGDIPVLADLINGRNTTITDKQLIFIMKIHVINPTNPLSLDPEQTAENIQSAGKAIESSRKLFPNAPPVPFFDTEEAVKQETMRHLEDRSKAAAEYYKKQEKNAASRQNAE